MYGVLKLVRFDIELISVMLIVVVLFVRYRFGNC